MGALQERLRILRGNKTQKEIVDDIYTKYNKSIPLANYANWERKSTPKVDDLIILANYFDVTIDYLIGRDEFSQREFQDFGSQCGLTNEAIKGLQVIRNKSNESNDLIGVLNFLLAQELDEDAISLSNLLELITGQDTSYLRNQISSLPDDDAKLALWLTLQAGLRQSAILQIEKMLTEWQKHLLR